MHESFLHYLWQYSLFSKPLKLTDGSIIEVLNVGIYNNDSGPDFFNAKIKIDENIWAGNIEIHLKSSDWYKHNHQEDEAYDNIILHVVAENDIQVKRKNGEEIPTAVLFSQTGIYEQYLYLMQSKSWVPCETFINKVNYFTVLQWKESLMIERLKTKASIIERRWHQNNKNFEETFYQTLAANFGFKTNAVPFEMLAKQLPLKYLLKHKDNLQSIESMLFGVAGLLPENSDNLYVKGLIENFKHYRNKFGLKTLNTHLWKYSKLRPSNFPTIRIAQFAQIIYNNAALFSSAIEAEKLTSIYELFAVEASEFWNTHFNFEKKAKKMTKRFGDIAFQNIVINTMAPFLAFYAHIKNNPEFSERAIGWLTELQPEKNSITKHWQQLGLEIKNAFDSQSLIQLKNIYCNTRKCLSCRIGNQVIQHKF